VEKKAAWGQLDGLRSAVEFGEARLHEAEELLLPAAQREVQREAARFDRAAKLQASWLAAEAPDDESDGSDEEEAMMEMMAMRHKGRRRRH